MASNRKGRGEVISRGRLAEVCGVSAPTVDHWVISGCPFVTRGGRGKAWAFNSADVMAWRIERAKDDAGGAAPADERDLKLRRLKALTELDELELAKARGEVAPLDQVTRTMEMAFGEVRAALRAVPARAARRILGETNETRVKAVLLDEIDQALEALADTDLADIDGIEDVDAAA
jgi:phage terminase Nu1 subunit (DNA packaging protein)